MAIRRHGDNTSDESARARELADVEGALEAAVDLYPLRELVPELDWAVLDPTDAERQALLSVWPMRWSSGCCRCRGWRRSCVSARAHCRLRRVLAPARAAPPTPAGGPGGC